MSLKVIEFNDSAVSVSDENGLLISSPGFALVGDHGLEVGEVAEQQARLKPTSSFNKFWHQLSLDPLSHSTGNIRHFADLAYAHLLHVSEKASLDGDVVLAVPGNFTGQQLSILLGLIRQCPFNTVGVVDAALANAIASAGDSPVIYADIQLHQALLTRFSVSDGKLIRDSVIQIPEVGLQNFMDLIMNIATNLFIKQCRFNPQHNAVSEQQLYNDIPILLERHKENKSSLLMEIKTPSTIHQAKLPWENLTSRLGEFYQRINHQVSALGQGDNCQVLLSSKLASLPDFLALSPLASTAQVIAPATPGITCNELQQHLVSSQEGFHLVTRLPISNNGAAAIRPASDSATATDATRATQPPTHVLYESLALPLGTVSIRNQSTGSTPQVNGSGILLSLGGLPEDLGKIMSSNGGIVLECGEAGALVNGEKVSGRYPLQLGDRVRFNNEGSEICLIRVRNGLQ